MTTERKARAGSKRWLRTLYNEINSEFFEGKLTKRLDFEWVKMPNNLVARVLWRRQPDGTYKPYTMQFSDLMKHRALQKKVGFSMLHEMAHVKLGVDVQCTEWDGEFDKEMFRLAKEGAFRLFW